MRQDENGPTKSKLEPRLPLRDKLQLHVFSIYTTRFSVRIYVDWILTNREVDTRLIERLHRHVELPR